MRTKKYAVVASAGRHSQNESVYAIYSSDSLERAKNYAKKATGEFQKSMNRYGGTSGYYRVVENNGTGQWEYGMDVDALPDC